MRERLIRLGNRDCLNMPGTSKRDALPASEIRSGHFERPALFLYDRIPGGVGLAVALFRAQRELVRAAREVLARCACERGCPACIGPLEEVGPFGKETALGVLVFLERGPEFVPAEIAPASAPASTT